MEGFKGGVEFGMVEGERVLNFKWHRSWGGGP